MGSEMPGMPEHVRGLCVGCRRDTSDHILRVPCCDDCKRGIESLPIQTLTEAVRTLAA